MNQSLLFLVATSLVVMMVTAKSVPLDKTKPVPPPSEPTQPATTTQKEKLPLPEEEGPTDYEEDYSKKVTEESSTTYEDDEKEKDDYEHSEDETEDGTKKKDGHEEYHYEEDVPYGDKKKHGNPTTEGEGEKGCLPALCADPKINEDGCESCDNSTCMFRGCVSYGAFFPTWKPDPCTFCVCIDGQEECTISDCGEEPNCYGYPLVTKPGHCCPECDYGIPNDECGLIPYKIQSLYVSLGDYSCQTDVLMHKCNKEYVYNSEEGEYYLCAETKGVHQIEMTDKCESRINEVTYTDTKSCEGIKADFSDLIHLIPFYDGPSDHCAFYVE